MCLSSTRLQNQLKEIQPPQSSVLLTVLNSAEIRLQQVSDLFKTAKG